MDEEVVLWERELSSRIRPLVLSALPDSVLELLSEIEAFAGTSVMFRDMELLRLAGSPNTNVEALYCDHERAYISVPDPQDINPNAVLHELLHLQRYWVEGVPQLDATTDIGANVELMTSIDNNLEHLIIVPRERRHGYDPSPYWASTLTDTLVQFPPPNSSEKWLLGACITLQMTASLTDDDAARNAIRGRLDDLGLLAEADKALGRIQAQRHSKPRMVRAALRAMKIPLKAGTLVKFDIRNRSVRRLAVPDL